MKSFFEKIKPKLYYYQEVKLKLKYKIFTQQELNSWVKHYDWLVRESVVKHNYGLNVLIDDVNFFVRWEVARQGYGLDKLVNDEHYCVREEAKHQLKIRGL